MISLPSESKSGGPSGMSSLESWTRSNDASGKL
jgi:hypothetical protein